MSDQQFCQFDNRKEDNNSAGGEGLPGPCSPQEEGWLIITAEKLFKPLKVGSRRPYRLYHHHR
jgi:hypothetical protein